MSPHAQLLSSSSMPCLPSLTDLDLLVSTDCEDLAALGGDLFEATAQDTALLVDFLTTPGLLVPVVVGCGTTLLLLPSWLKR